MSRTICMQDAAGINALTLALCLFVCFFLPLSHSVALAVLCCAARAVGGRDSQSFFNDVLRWQYSGEDWTALAPPPFSPRFGHATVYHAATASIVMVGGLDGSVRGGAALNDVYASSDAGASWTTLTTQAPFSPRYLACLVSAGDALWLAGGFPGTPGGLMDLWRSTDGGLQWSDLTPRRRGPVSRFAQTLGRAGGKMFMIGGLTTERPFQVLNGQWDAAPGARCAAGCGRHAACHARVLSCQIAHHLSSLCLPL